MFKFLFVFFLLSFFCCITGFPGIGSRLVKLAARAFYDDMTKGDNQPKTGRSDNRGIAVVVLDALTRFWL